MFGSLHPVLVQFLVSLLEYSNPFYLILFTRLIGASLIQKFSCHIRLLDPPNWFYRGKTGILSELRSSKWRGRREKERRKIWIERERESFIASFTIWWFFLAQFYWFSFVGLQSFAMFGSLYPVLVFLLVVHGLFACIGGLFPTFMNILYLQIRPPQS